MDTLINIGLGTLGWVLSGYFAVYLSGMVDRMYQKTRPEANDAPVGLIFLLGPIGIVLCITGFFLITFDKALDMAPTEFKILDAVYRKGKGDKNGNL